MKDKINGRTPEEIKNGLSTCTQSGDCPNCPYETDCKEHAESGDNLWLGEPAMADALAYIQQLERERDAAVEQLKAVDVNSYFECAHCKREELCNSPVWLCNDCDNEECPCHTCTDGSNWQWRGVQEVE